MENKSKETMTSSLLQNLQKDPVANESVVAVKDISAEVTDVGEEDYAFARMHIKKLIDTSDTAISTMMDLASDSEHPRAYEVLTAMIKNTADMSEQLVNLVKKRQAFHGIDRPKDSVNSITNNAIFVGTTVELQNLIKDRNNTVDI
jgi:hypothetical protein